MANALIDEIIQEVTQDQIARRELLANPREFLAARGLDISEDIELVLVEAKPGTLYLPLFPFVGDRASLETLTNVTGGKSATSMLPSGLTAAAAGIAQTAAADSGFWMLKLTDQRNT